jgi:RND superfamily putative drug exporter
VRQFGVGLAVAVLLDATIVRLILLPALIRLLGEWTWWMPRRLAGAQAEHDVVAAEAEAVRQADGAPALRGALS